MGGGGSVTPALKIGGGKSPKWLKFLLQVPWIVKLMILKKSFLWQAHTDTGRYDRPKIAKSSIIFDHFQYISRFS
jgi:hypothetical protein